MADSRASATLYVRLIATLFALLVAPVCFAAPNFITGTKITRGSSVAEISIQFACVVEYVNHLPATQGDRLRIQLDVTQICTGVSPSIAQSSQQHRPKNAVDADLIEIEYDGNAGSSKIVTLFFDQPVRYEVIGRGASDNISIRVYFASTFVASRPSSGASGVKVQREALPGLTYVINLSSSQRPHASSEIPNLALPKGIDIFESTAQLGGVTWYRLRLGPFDNSADANAELSKVRDLYPTAWIDQASATVVGEIRPTIIDAPSAVVESQTGGLSSIGLDQIDRLMEDGRVAMLAAEYSRAVQIYTKVLSAPTNDRQAQAQEFLGLAREKNGQVAHAKAEYQRYIALYPDGEGTARVRQRLAALVAVNRQSMGSGAQAGLASNTNGKVRSPWRLQTYFSQFYRRDVNQPSDADEIISQSALYSDLNFDARRRGERFDFGSRLSMGYRNDFLGDEGSGNNLRVFYAYADLADAATGLQGRVGRQSRTTGGILGRFDGVDLGYAVGERFLVNAAMGSLVSPSSNSSALDRTFYGASVNYGPVLDGLDVSLFFVQQQVEDINDRQAIGTEFRYFGDSSSFWGLIDYDTSYNELGSAFLQGSWRINQRLSIHGSLDRRHSPFLSASNAIIGQPVESFSELLLLMTEEEIRLLSLDRSPLSTTYTAGVSYSMTQRLQLNADANQTSIKATPASGGVAAMPETNYRYFNSSIVASSLLREGDVTIFGFRYSDTDMTKVYTMTLDARFPFGRTWRINPRLRVDKRETISDNGHEWLYTPGIRFQVRWTQKFRIDLEAGKQFSQRTSANADMDRESYFFNLGYQAFF